MAADRSTFAGGRQRRLRRRTQPRALTSGHEGSRLCPRRRVGHPAGERRRSRCSSSSTRSVGARMKTSHIMSGCCWLPLMKPITWRPVALSITASKRDRISSWNSMRCWMTEAPRPPSSRVCSTRVKPPRSRHTTRSSSLGYSPAGSWGATDVVRGAAGVASVGRDADPPDGRESNGSFLEPALIIAGSRRHTESSRPSG